jgi:hypothetical protein
MGERSVVTTQLTRGERAIRWIAEWCQAPSGPVQLSAAERKTLYRIFDADLPDPVDGRLAAFVALLYLAGPEARTGEAAPRHRVDIFTLWNAASPELRVHLRRHGSTVICDALGTSWSTAA